MSFINSSGLDELARRLAESVPESVRAFGRDLEGNFKAVLQAQLSKLDLVSRQEFDVQAALLARTQAMLTALEARLKELETNPTPAIAGSPAAGHRGWTKARSAPFGAGPPPACRPHWSVSRRTWGP